MSKETTKGILERFDNLHKNRLTSVSKYEYHTFIKKEITKALEDQKKENEICSHCVGLRDRYKTTLKIWLTREKIRCRKDCSDSQWAYDDVIKHINNK